MKKALLFVPVTALLTGCSASPPPPPPPVVQATAGEPMAPPKPDPVPSATATAEAPKPGVLLAGRGDVDGKPGGDPLTLYADGKLTAGRLTGVAHFDLPNDYDLNKDGQLSVVRLSDAVPRAVLVRIPTPEDEDPPMRYLLFVPSGEVLKLVFDEVIGSYGVHPIAFPGDGTMTYVQDGWGACTGTPSARQGQKAPLHEVTYGPGPDGRFVVTGHRKTGTIYDCNDLAACPYVDVIDRHGHATEVGEILRHLRGRRAYDHQTLTLPSTTDRVVQVRLREDKPEVTHLDAIFLEADGQLLAPRRCAEAVVGLCTADGQATLLVEGDRLDLFFDLPAPAARLVLHATGYYQPKPMRPTTR